jgi:uncharacterized protein YciI
MNTDKTDFFLPDDPRHGLDAEGLKTYYRTKAAQWVVTVWYAPDAAAQRDSLLPAQQRYVAGFGDRVIGYGHIVPDDGAGLLATTFFVQLDDRAAADAFVADEPLNRAGIVDRITVQRWSNSFLKRQADYRRKDLQQFFCTGSKIADTGPLFAAHLADHERYFKRYEDSFIFRGPIRSADGADNIGTALLLELPDRAATETFWNEEPFAAHGGYQDDSRIYRWTFGD